MATTNTVQKDLKKTADDTVALAKSTADTVQQTVIDFADDVKETTNRIFRAGLGAFALAEEEGSKLFDTLVKKGEKVDVPVLGGEPLTKLRKEIDTQTDRVTDAVKGRASDAKYMAGEATEKVEDRLQDAVALVMKRLGVPTREEISELTAGVERLNKRLDAVKKERKNAPKTEMSFTSESVGGGWYELKVNGVVVDKVQGKEEAETALARLAEQKA